MTLKNSIRLLFASFNLVWKSGLYKLCCITFVVLASLNFVLPVVNFLIDADFFTSLSSFFTQGVFVFDGVHMVEYFGICLNSLSDLILADGMLTDIIVVAVLLIVVLPFLCGLSTLAESEVLFGTMSSNSRFSFSCAFVSNLGRSIRLSAFKLLFTVPYTVISLLLIYLLIGLYGVSSVFAIFTTSLILIAIVLLVSVYRIFFMGVAPATIVLGRHPNDALKATLPRIIRKVGRFLSGYVLMLVFGTAICAFFGAYTFGVGLLISLPFLWVLLSIFDMVAYYGMFGMDYYVEPNNIVRSPRLEVQNTVKTTKYII